uniref:non-specific serine/threonine protein kinase n=1 Tax=Caenorhabditis japonica TaxID=281687 RepID=A0A8R1DGB3_CAEJA
MKETKQEDPSPPVTTVKKENSEDNGVFSKAVLPKMKKYDYEEATQLSVNEKFLKRWLIDGLIGKGGYGEIYLGMDIIRNEEVAIKVEPKKRRGKLAKRMILEQLVLLKMQGKTHVPTIYGSGYTEKINFIVMQILSVNIGDIKKKCNHKRLSATSVGRIVHQLISALRDLHDFGYVHRDVKPANMCFGISSNAREDNRHTVYLLDFGLVRRFKLPNGERRPPRYRAGFRGTTRYVSLRVHRRIEQSPYDDIVSAMYTAYELLCSELPWKRLERAEEVLQLKQSMTEFQGADSKPGLNLEMFQGASSVLVDFFNTVIGMDPEKDPCYDKLIECMKILYAPKTMEDPYDWEDQQKTLEECSEENLT